jgi:hypothetical protein
MAVTWEEADERLIHLAQRLIRENHPHLLDAKIGFMYRSEAAKSGNKLVLGKARKVSEEQQVFIDFDFVIWVARKEFYEYMPEQCEAMVDHELCHCGGSFGEWKIKHHDVDEFLSIVVRHGLWHPDLSFAAKAFENAGKGQAALFYPEDRGAVASVPKVIIKRFGAELDQAIDKALDQLNADPTQFGKNNLIERARVDPEGVAADLYKAAELLKQENGGEITVSLLQRKFRIGYSHAAKIKELLDQVTS